jgi:hypothetical protein
MIKARILFCYKTDERPDDVVTIYSTDTAELYHVKFKPGDFDGAWYEVYMTHERLMSYLDTAFKSLQYDDDPFERVQVDAAMYPSIFYHIADLSSSRTRDFILSIVQDALYLDSEKVVE